MIVHRCIFAGLWLLALCAAAVARAGNTLAYYDANDTFYESYTAIVFEASDSFIFYVAPGPPGMTIPGSHIGMGSRTYMDPDGNPVPIPEYVINARMALEAAKAYADAHDLEVTDFHPGNRFPVYIAPVDGASRNSRTGAWADGTMGETVYRRIGDWYMTIDPGLSESTLITICLHEYFHVIQNARWSIHGITTFTSGSGLAHSGAIEGTAEFFSDQPVLLNMVGARKPASTADQLNEYVTQRGGYFNKPHEAPLEVNDGYESVFFWKAFAEHVGGGPIGEMAAITAFWDGYSSRNVRGLPQLMEEVGSVAGGAGRRQDRFRQVLRHYLAAAIVQTGAPHGFKDDGFADATRVKASHAQLNRWHYSMAAGNWPAVADSVAADDGAIRNRLAGILATTAGIGLSETATMDNLGMRLYALSPPEPWGKVDANGNPQHANVVFKPTPAFVLVKADQPDVQGLVTVGFIQGGSGRLVDRGPNVTFTMLDDFAFSDRVTLEGRPVALAKLTELGGAQPYMWFGVAGAMPDGSRRTYSYAYVVTPVFEDWYTVAGRSTRTVKFVEAVPAREDAKPLLPGDRVTLEVNLTDSIHDGGPSSIPENQRSLTVELLAPDGSVVPVEDARLDCADRDDWLYHYLFTIPKDHKSYGAHTVRWTLRSRLKLGETDKHIDETMKLDIQSDRPQVSGVIVRSEREIVYHRREQRLLPLGPGPATVEIYFEKAMDQTQPATVLLDGQALAGEWKGSTWWQAAITVPAVGTAGWNDYRGFHALSIQATGANGEAIDTDPATAALEPDTQDAFFVGSVPPYLSTFQATAAGATVYEAEWTGWDGVSTPFENLRLREDAGMTRKLNLKTSTDLPAEGAYLHFAFRTSQPFDTPPTLTIEGRDVPVEPISDGYFSAKILIEELAAQIRTGRSLAVVIRGADRYGQKLDGNPGTVPLLDPAQPTQPWSFYEDRRGGTDSRQGGEDLWHEIGPAPTISLVVVLDASGSMEGGKIASAKAGIAAMIDELHPKVELGLVVFSGCDNIRVYPFSRDIAQLRKVVEDTQAGGGTPLAKACQQARELLLSAAHPQSREWKCRIFSDGQESCSGDAALDILELERVTALRERPPPLIPAETPPADGRPPNEEMEARPASWSTYRVRVRDGVLHIDTLYLERVSFLERELPNGVVYASLSVTSYAINYGGVTGGGPVRWWPSSRGSESSESVTSRDGRAAVEALRARAEAIRAAGKSQADCRAEIDARVQENVR